MTVWRCQTTLFSQRPPRQWLSANGLIELYDWLCDGAATGHPKRADCSDEFSGSQKLVSPTPMSRNSCAGSRPTRSRSDRAILVSSSHDEGGEYGVLLRVRMSNSLVLSFRTTVRPIRDSLRDAAQTFSARRRMNDSVSVKRTSCSNVSSADIDFVGLLGTTSE